MSYKPTKWENRVYDEQGNILRDGTGLWAEFLNNMEAGILRANIMVDREGKPDGIATLDEHGIVNASQLPANLKEMEIVYSIEEMEEIEPKFKGLRIMIIEEERKKWSEYVYDGKKFIEVANSDQFNIVIDWDNIKDKPKDFTPAPHTHTEEDIEDLDKYTKQEVDDKLKGKSPTGHIHKEDDIGDLDKYSREEIDTKLKDKSNIHHTHDELHIHSNKSALDKIVHIGAREKINLEEIYTHTHQYAEIKGKPAIPSKITDLTDNVDLVTSDTQARKIFISEGEPEQAKEGDIWIRI